MIIITLIVIVFIQFAVIGGLITKNHNLEIGYDVSKAVSTIEVEATLEEAEMLLQEVK